MRKIILFSFTLLLTLTIKAQQKFSYAYDAAGNRVNRTIVLESRSTDAFQNPMDSIFFEQSVADKKIRVYPNPVETTLTIDIRGPVPMPFVPTGNRHPSPRRAMSSPRLVMTVMAGRHPFQTPARERRPSVMYIPPPVY